MTSIAVVQKEKERGEYRGFVRTGKVPWAKITRTVVDIDEHLRRDVRGATANKEVQP